MPSNSRKAMFCSLLLCCGNFDFALLPWPASHKKNNAEDAYQRENETQNSQGCCFVSITLADLVQVNREGVNPKKGGKRKFTHCSRKGQQSSTDHAGPDVGENYRE